jgi:pimeloyl-ACP methyl ester carboxylesterase
MAEDATPAAEAPSAPPRRGKAYGEVPPEADAPLAPYGGARPPAPAWFDAALAQAPEEILVESLGAKIELLTWGEVGKPGLLLVHGTGSHAHWWAHIAPFLADHYRVAAMSLAGYGGSDWRERYSSLDSAEDAEACARAAGLYEGGRKPVYIGHSLGGAQVFCAAEAHPERLHAAVLIDSSFRGPGAANVEEMRASLEARHAASGGVRAERVYESEAAALARFRLAPLQAVRAPYIADYMARKALGRVPLPDGSGLGWAWRHDPAMWVKLERGHEQGPFPDGPIRVDVPVAHMVGDRSHVVAFRQPNGDPLTADVPVFAIPDCGHHVMIDQPMALVAALRALLAVWPA